MVFHGTCEPGPRAQIDVRWTGELPALVMWLDPDNSVTFQPPHVRDGSLLFVGFLRTAANEMGKLARDIEIRRTRALNARPPAAPGQETTGQHAMRPETGSGSVEPGRYWPDEDNPDWYDPAGH